MTRPWVVHMRADVDIEDVRSAIRGRCMVLWEHIVELKAEYLRRYGEVPADLGEYLDPRAERLIQGILHILDALKPGQAQAEDEDRP
jgi:hypothetical protein